MIKKLLVLSLSVVMVVSLFVGCSNNTETNTTETEENSAEETATPTPEEKPLLELTLFHSSANINQDTVSNANDVVTPYVEKKFNIKLKDVYLRNDQSSKERINQWIASDSLPDFIAGDRGTVDYAISTGEFIDLTPYYESGQLANVKKFFDEKYGPSFWPQYFSGDGKMYKMPQFYWNAALPEYEDDIYSAGDFAWALWAREDILQKLGYKFTPLEDLKQKVDQGIKPTADDLKIEPAIDTPEKFAKLLLDIKNLNLKVGNKNVTPFSSSWWSPFHVGTMFDYGVWALNKTDGSVNGWLGSNDNKTYWNYFTNLYRQGLIDPDMFSQKDEQLQSKIASGQVATGMYIPDLNAAVQGMQQIDPSYKIRFIPWPKLNPDNGFFDVKVPGFYSIIIKKDAKDIDRIIEFMNWSISDEALDLFVWGPEEAGLWKLQDGKKVFTDPKMEDFALNGPSDSNTNPGTKGIAFNSKIARMLPIHDMGKPENPFWYTRSYKASLDLYNWAKSTMGASGVNKDGRASYGDGGEANTTLSDHNWGTFMTKDLGRLLTTKTDAEFDKAWEEIYAAFLRDAQYEQAKKDMEVYYKEYGPK